MTMQDITTPRASESQPPASPAVVYYPDEEADKDGPRVVSPRLQSLPKKMKCAREYAARLALLLHARKCSDSATCAVRHCAVAKGVLSHCQECSRLKCHPSCRQAKILLRHYRKCSSRNATRPCLVCAILEKEFYPKRHLNLTN